MQNEAWFNVLVGVLTIDHTIGTMEHTQQMTHKHPTHPKNLSVSAHKNNIQYMMKRYVVWFTTIRLFILAKTYIFRFQAQLHINIKDLLKATKLKTLYL